MFQDADEQEDGDGAYGGDQRRGRSGHRNYEEEDDEEDLQDEEADQVFDDFSAPININASNSNSRGAVANTME